MPDHDSSQDPDTPSFLDSSESDDEDTSEPQHESPTDSPPLDSMDNGTEEVEAEASPERDELHFEDEDLGDQLRRADDEELNAASFGIISVDDEGSVEFFNEYESELSGMDPDEVKGKNFFTQVAPCTNNRLFRGRFKKGVRRGELDESFTYTYTYKMRPTLVDVHLYRDEAGNNWITVQKY